MIQRLIKLWRAWQDKHRCCWHEDGPVWQQMPMRGCREGVPVRVMRYHCCGCPKKKVRRCGGW